MAPSSATQRTHPTRSTYSRVGRAPLCRGVMPQELLRPALSSQQGKLPVALCQRLVSTRFGEQLVANCWALSVLGFRIFALHKARGAPLKRVLFKEFVCVAKSEVFQATGLLGRCHQMS